MSLCGTSMRCLHRAVPLRSATSPFAWAARQTRSQALSKHKACGLRIGTDTGPMINARLSELKCAQLSRGLAHRSVTTRATEAEVTEAVAVAGDWLEAQKLDIRVGKVISAELHPDADSLYVEQVDVGEEEPRTIISGLVKYVPIEDMQGRPVMVLCNLKPRNMRGIKSNGMLLCASNDTHEIVEPLMPPDEAQCGERVAYGDDETATQPEPETPNKVQKKKIWEGVQPDLKTNEQRQVVYKGTLMKTGSGPVMAATLANASIS